VIRSAGSFGANSGFNCAIFFRNQDDEPVQPTRSATTVAGIDGVAVSSRRTSASKSSKADEPEPRRYCGGPAE
jgi:hypothetical protein